MAGGYTGKVLRIYLTKKSISTIDTEHYEEYGGGHGIGSAIFGDLISDQLPLNALDPRNVITIMTSPFSGVLVPAAAGRCEVQGVGPQGYPVEWFTRSNFGGRFSSQLKYAGWDGTVIKCAILGADFHEFEGWNPANGWPKSAVRESLGLNKVADGLRTVGKLG